MKQRNSKVLVLWDGDQPPPVATDTTYLWNQYDDSGNSKSILAYCEIHASRLRDRYCRWVGNLGELRIGESSLIDHLTIRGAFSFWWMSLLVEKAGDKSPGIVDAIRLLALEEVLEIEKPGVLRVVSDNRELSRAVRSLSHKLAIRFQSVQPGTEDFREGVIRRFKRAMPMPLRALASIARYFWSYRALRKGGAPKWFDGENSVFFCSYIDNLDPAGLLASRFRSLYWSSLPEQLNRNAVRCNWLQIYVHAREIPNPEAGARLLGDFNQDANTNGQHAFVDSAMSWPVLIRVVADYLHLLIRGFALGGIRRGFTPEGSKVDLWSILGADLRNSLRGPAAIRNVLWLHLFDKAIGSLPRQRKGLYLCENQAWERAFIWAWKRHGHGTLIAVPHSTRSFWDLRFHLDASSFDSAAENRLPMPDITAVNGKASMKVFVENNYPKDAFVEVEALRYLYLNSLPSRRPEGGTESNGIKLLVLGDFSPIRTRSMMIRLENALKLCRHHCELTVKPHPNCAIDAADYPTIAMEIVSAPLGELLREYDMVVSSNATSAAVDAYLSGSRLAVMLDDGALNASPLRDVSGVSFVANADDLARAIDVLGAGSPADQRQVEAFFNLDQGLPKWSRLLLD